MATTLSEPIAATKSSPTTKLLGLGVIVFLSNGGLLVLQLVVGRLIAPFVGSSLEVWSAVIGTFLGGMALGNAVGGWLADRSPTARKLATALALALAAGAIGTLWVMMVPKLLHTYGWQSAVPLGLRIPLLAVILGFFPAFALSLPTPLAIRLGTPDLRHAGRIVGMVFALGTLGSLVGNYVTGFYLLPTLTVDGIALATAATLGTVALVTSLFRPSAMTTFETPAISDYNPAARGRLPMLAAYAIVFMCSFAGMALELSGTRLIAQILGVSLYTWTGVIGVMLAGTALGNATGGWIADRAGRSNDPNVAVSWLIHCLCLAAIAFLMVLMVFTVGSRSEFFSSYGLVTQVIGWTFVMFFPAMFFLGTVTPQVIKLTVPDLSFTGRVAGRVYAWSMVGAIAGTLAAGFGLVPLLGMYRLILILAILPVAAMWLVAPIWKWRLPLYGTSLVVGSVVAGFMLLDSAKTGIWRDTNYFTIMLKTGTYPRIEPELSSDRTMAAISVAGPAGVIDPPGTVYSLQLDRLTHSRVKLSDPTYLYYPHENVQMELLRTISDRKLAEEPRVLVVGGGGYTFPRCAKTVMPRAVMDVVEIDPWVTKVTFERLGLDPELGINSFHMDGRQFVTEKADTDYYDLVTLDAVNDLTVPYHLLTREFNEQIRRVLMPEGIYLLTVIDRLEDGLLWRAAVNTLKETFPHVHLLSSRQNSDPSSREVFVIYASDKPFEVDKVRTIARNQGVKSPFTHAVPNEFINGMLDEVPALILTDQFAPVDNLMAGIFRHRKFNTDN